jgi:hypothetical protein
MNRRKNFRTVKIPFGFAALPLPLARTVRNSGYFMTHRTAKSLLLAALLLVRYQSPTQAQPADPEGPYYPSIPLEDALEEKGGLTRLSLQFKEAPLQDVLNEIEKQSGFKLLASMREKVKPLRVTVTAQEQPFWVTIRGLSQQTGMNFRIVPEALGTGPRQNIAMTYAGSDESFNGIPFVKGPFLLVANSLQQTTTATVSFEEPAQLAAVPALGLKQEKRYTELWFSIFPDPKLPTKNSEAVIQIDSAVDENGRSLNLTNNQMNNYVSYSSRNVFNQRLNARLAVPAGAGQRIAKLRGTVSFFYARKTEHWEINDAQNAPPELRQVSSNGQNRTYRFEGVKKTDPRYEVLMKVTGDTPNEWTQGPKARLRSNGLPVVQLMDSDGNLLLPMGASHSFGNEVTVRGTFQKTRTFRNIEALPNAPLALGAQSPVEGPMKLLIDIPHDYVELKFPFEFTDLPLP